MCFAAGIFALLSVIGWILYVPPVAKTFGQFVWLCADPTQPLRGGEPCQFKTADGLTLRGTFLSTPAPERKGVIAFCHELTGERACAVKYAHDLCQRGFDVLTFDFRNHGTSDSLQGYKPMPWLTRFELDDVRAAIDYLSSRPDADPRGIGLFGISRGGSAAICAAAGDERVRAIVTDGAFPTEAMQIHYMRRYAGIYTPMTMLLSHLPDWMLRVVGKWAQWIIARQRRCGFVNVEQSARRVTQPVLMIHGADDSFVPLDVVHTLYACLPAKTRLWVVPGARHNSAIVTERKKYEKRIARFFCNHFDTSRPRRSVEEAVPLGQA